MAKKKGKLQLESHEKARRRLMAQGYRPRKTGASFFKGQMMAIIKEVGGKFEIT